MLGGIVKVAVFNQKGGVGRTTTALNLLAAIARRGHRPWGIDLDPHTQLSAIFGVAPRRAEESMVAFFLDRAALPDLAQITRSGVVVCPGHHDLGKVDATLGKGLAALTRLRQGLEGADTAGQSIVMDCPPLLNVLALNALFACELVLVPLTADYLALQAARDVDRALNALQPVLKQRLPRRYLLTRFVPGNRMAEDVAAQLGESLRVEELCTARIRESIEVAQSPRGGLDVFRHAADSAGAQDYDALLDELLAAGFRA